MAMVSVAVHHQDEAGLERLTLYVSEEYLPEKDKGPDGEYLPNQQWRHADARTLQYSEIGTLSADSQIEGIILARS